MAQKRNYGSEIDIVGRFCSSSSNKASEYFSFFMFKVKHSKKTFRFTDLIYAEIKTL